MLYSLIGIGLRRPHYQEFIKKKPKVGWVEVHSENYLSLGGPSYDTLLEVRKDYSVSLHGIGMSLGSAEGLNKNHLSRLKDLIDKVEPFLVSDHLSWSSADNHFVPDLLPTPYNEETLQVFRNNILFAQDYLKREILFENPSTYYEYNNSTYSEAEFLNLLVSTTGAGILLDLNNIYISALNNGWAVREYLSNIKQQFVREIHLSGHSVKTIGGEDLLYIDSHDNKVCDEVWQIYEFALQRFSELPTLIEWDTNIPSLDVLLAEAQKAENYLARIGGVVA